MNPISVAIETVEGSVRACDECGIHVPFDNPDAKIRLCIECYIRLAWNEK